MVCVHKHTYRHTPFWLGLMRKARLSMSLSSRCQRMPRAGKPVKPPVEGCVCRRVHGLRWMDTWGLVMRWPDPAQTKHASATVSWCRMSK